MTREQISALQHLFYGRDDVPGRRDLESGWKAAKAIAARGRGLTEGERQCLFARMSAAGTPAEVIEEVMRADDRAALEGLAAGELPWQTAAWILYEALSVAMAEHELGDPELEPFRQAAARLRLSDEAASALVDVCRDEAALRARRIGLLSSRLAATPRFDLL